MQVNNHPCVRPSVMQLRLPFTVRLCTAGTRWRNTSRTGQVRPLYRTLKQSLTPFLLLQLIWGNEWIQSVDMGEASLQTIAGNAPVNTSIRSLPSMNTDGIHVHRSKTWRHNRKPGTNYFLQISSSPKQLLPLMQEV